MPKIYQNFFIAAFLLLCGNSVFAQIPTDSTSFSVNPALKDIFTGRIPKKYTVAGIKVTGTKSFDQNLIISISGIAIGDVISLPGSDVFGKAINKLWKQSLVSDAAINITKLATKIKNIALFKRLKTFK